ncbi:MAG: dienelactone hydrolase family protein [Pirellulales bacterium]|nr:dienelactone hydrolase family protein [Pirellulales bacterium]
MKSILARHFGLTVAAIVATVMIVVSLHMWRPRLSATVLTDETIEVDGVRREYRLVIPDALDGQTPAPVVFAFHGAHETPEEMARNSQLDWLAAARGFYLVYPMGCRQSWPASMPDDDPEHVERDLRFFDALYNRLTQQLPIDKRRVHPVGLSQGAVFVELLVEERSELLAAAVSHSGWLPGPLSRRELNTKHKCPIMFIAGSDDRQVPPADVKKAADFFRHEGHPVELLVLDGLDHRWAGDFDINIRIWRFLSRHPRDKDD